MKEKMARWLMSCDEIEPGLHSKSLFEETFTMIKVNISSQVSAKTWLLLISQD